MSRIFSYESLFEKWLNDKQVKSLVAIGRNLRNDREGFLYENPKYLIELASQQEDLLMFYTMLYCYEPSELESVSDIELSLTQREIFNNYKDSMLDAVDRNLSSNIFSLPLDELWIK
ncbi:hypothetical protein [Vibrio sp. D431a]|uniref:hypothetical protein n=1 Tax=Vibrio sp. D431a TaxID=2837388 RepID=UPI002552692F|nr:hypothetical protein [Vibrio sp. D431a]MDK9793881.1 hypothetical protein [Vibrio sp. D431a]